LFQELQRQVHSTLRTILAIALAVVLLFGLVAFLSLRLNLHPGLLLGEPAVAGALSPKRELLPLMGLVANVANTLWMATVSVCLFCFACLRSGIHRSNSAKFFLFAGLFALWLLVDDMFLLHDSVFKRYLGLPELAVYVAYTVVLAFFLIRFRRFVAGTEWLLLALAIGLFMSSGMLDIVPLEAIGREFVEDGFKVLGLALWLAYFFRTGCQQIRNSIGLSSRSPA